MKIILSTRNRSKADQVRALFPPPRFTIVTLDEAGIVGNAVEDGSTLGDNALAKALYARKQLCGAGWVMADDTGLFIDALGGKPGIHAARWAGPDASTSVVTKHTLKALRDMNNRRAEFRCKVALVASEKEFFFFEGSIAGTILTRERCNPQPDMPYSGIFVPEGSHKVWAQMSVEEENAISHRGKAFREARAFLEKIAESK
jgi:XTP/dITP diphosphohydrolase